MGRPARQWRHGDGCSRRDEPGYRAGPRHGSCPQNVRRSMATRSRSRSRIQQLVTVGMRAGSAGPRGELRNNPGSISGRMVWFFPGLPSMMGKDDVIGSYH